MTSRSTFLALSAGLRRTATTALLSFALATALLAVLFGNPRTVQGTGERLAAADESSDLRIATYNIRADRSLSQFAAGAGAVLERADIVGFQEVNTYAKIEYLDEQDGWGTYYAPDRLQEPVVWNEDRFEFIDAEGVWLVKRSAQGDRSEATTKRDNVYATYVQLRDRVSGERLQVLNVHLQHGVVKAGRPNPDADPAKYRVYQTEVKSLVRFITAEQRAGRRNIYLLGDFNAGYVPDEARRHPDLPYKNFTPLGMASMWKSSPYKSARQGTREDALIDQVWSWRQPIDTEIAYDINVSDHYPAIATY